MALTKVVAAGIATGGDYEVVTLTTSGNVQVGSATTIHTSGIDLGSGVINSHNINSTGVITATSFVGDISQATGAAAGLGTALSQDQSNPLNKIYYTDTILSIGSTQTVNPPDSSNIAYTQYAEIAVEEGFDLIVEDGDDLVPDILGLSTETAGVLAGAGGRVRADNFTNKAGTGAPTFPNGVNVTGVLTATSFSGNVTGDVTGNLTGNVTVATGATISGSTNTITASTNGTERLRITSDGNIGIGTFGPTTKFEVGDVSGGVRTPDFSINTVSTASSITIGRLSSVGGDNTSFRIRDRVDRTILYTYVSGVDVGQLDYSSTNLNIKNGNLVFSTSGTGIDFSATANSSGTMSSELLDDYEEGTWTPTVGGTATYVGTPQGYYVKIGSVVHVRGLIWVSTRGTGSQNTISGLPFNNGSQVAGGSVWRWYGSAVSVYWMGCAVDAGSGGIFLTGQSGLDTISETSINAIGDGTLIGFSATYFT